MRHRNSVRQLGRTHAHRKAMYNNMVTSLFTHEKIVTTKQKGKELKKISERLITRAKKNLALTDDQASQKLHNKREIMKVITNRDIVKKLFENIAPRFKDRSGGYTRLYLLGQRPGDGAEMAIVELVDREQPSQSKEESTEKDKKQLKKEKKEKKEKEKKAKKDKE
ncbi:MAG: 50S ribosomal protein L17 [bacterium]|nr:50S ribosomal protein L17 [bacterium]